MKKTLIILFILSNVFIAQVKKPHGSEVQGLQCSTCHSCEVPTKNNPCLYPCPRYMMPTKKLSASIGPETILIDKIRSKNDLYKPVLFSHRLHAEMSDLSGGCETCHHYNPVGEILKCENCHSLDRKREQVNKPDLKGAYHQQCMNCHKLWSHEVECNSCHVSNKVKAVITQDYSKKKHEKIDIPVKKVYNTNFTKGKIVTFLHTEHNTIFKQDCTNCHNNTSCVTCHDKKPELTKNRVEKDKHAKCKSCHNTKTNCENCHKNSETAGFNHFARTGFELTGAHLKLSCDKCHTKAGTFKGLNRNCTSCHNNFLLGSFNHKVTGLELDDNHIEAECTDCHINNDFTKKDCNNCHEGYSYPKQKPGKLVK